jgi:hypothetical protein
VVDGWVLVGGKKLCHSALVAESVLNVDSCLRRNDNRLRELKICWFPTTEVMGCTMNYITAHRFSCGKCL